LNIWIRKVGRFSNSSPTKTKNQRDFSEQPLWNATFSHSSDHIGPSHEECGRRQNDNGATKQVARIIPDHGVPRYRRTINSVCLPQCSHSKVRSSAFSSECGQRFTKCASALQYWQTIGVM
jgi:hypothetical protein